MRQIGDLHHLVVCEIGDRSEDDRHREEDEGQTELLHQVLRIHFVPLLLRVCRAQCFHYLTKNRYSLISNEKIRKYRFSKQTPVNWTLS